MSTAPSGSKPDGIRWDDSKIPHGLRRQNVHTCVEAQYVYIQETESEDGRLYPHTHLIVVSPQSQCVYLVHEVGSRIIVNRVHF